MKKNVSVCLLFGVIQFVLSLVVWGNFEFSIYAGDMVPGTDVSIWSFILRERTLPYAFVSIFNLIVLGFLISGFRSVALPGFGGTLALAVGTVVLTFFLSLNTPFRIPPPFAAIVALVATWAAYFATSMAIKRVLLSKDKDL